MRRRQRARNSLVLATLCLLAAGATAGESAPPRTVGFAQDTLQNDWRIAQVREFQAAFADQAEVRVLVTDAGGDTALQARDLLQLAAAPVDVLVTSPRDGQVLAPVVTEVVAAGIPVVLLTRRLDGDPQTSLIGPDDHAIGRRAGHFIATALGGRGRILILEGVPTASTAQDRSAGFLEAIADYPGLTIAAREVANYLRSDAVHAVERVLAGGVEFDAIYAQSDSMAAGARLALRRAGLDPAALVIVGIDYIAEAREAIRRGEQTASFTYPTAAREGAAVVRALLNGEPVPARVTVPSQLVTRDNVELVEPIF